MLDKLTGIMMSFITTYFESCGNTLETVFTDQEINVKTRSSSMVHYQTKRHHPQQEAVVLDDVQQEVTMCFHCGSFPELSSLAGHDKGDDAADGKRSIELRRFDDSDIEFFPVPSSEVLTFYGKNDPRFRGLSAVRSKHPKTSTSNVRSMDSIGRSQETYSNWTAPRFLSCSPSPEVATKWISMGVSDKESKLGPTPQREKEDIQPFPFDEAPNPNLSRLMLRKHQRPPTVPRRPPFVATTNTALFHGGDVGNEMDKRGHDSSHIAVSTPPPTISRNLTTNLIPIPNSEWTYSTPLSNREKTACQQQPTTATAHGHNLNSSATTSDSGFFQRLKFAPRTTCSFADSRDENHHHSSSDSSINRHLYRCDRAPCVPDIFDTPERNRNILVINTAAIHTMGEDKETSNLKSSKGGGGDTKSHWKPAVDPRTGRTYYYHEITRETQWRKPMELATDEEKRAMEEKERKQKDFFAAMEANILNCISQGVVPGTPKIGAGEGTSLLGGPGRRMSSRKVSLGPDGRPELVRTISTMDENVLMDVIRRQPSFRNFTPGSRVDSLEPADLLNTRRRSSEVRDGFENWSQGSQNQPLETLEERFNESTDSMPALLSFLPDGSEEDDGKIDSGDLRLDGGELNESSLKGFGLTWEETQALKKLASITKEMIDAEKDVLVFEESPPAKNSKIAAAAGATSSWKPPKDDKEKRDLPRELDFDDSDDDESESHSHQQLPSLNKAREGSDGRALPREIDLDFDSSDEESERAPTPKDSKLAQKKKGASKKEKGLERPEVKRRNTCGTMYIGTTMSAPDKDATIRCVCGVVRSHILSSEHDTRYNPETDAYKVFNDQESEQGGQSFEFSSKVKTAPKPPSLDEVSTFYRDIFFKAQMEADCIIMSLIYVERLIKKTAGRLRPRAGNWRSLLFSCMILSSKVWDDLSMWNVDFSQSCPPGVSFSLKRINELELAVLNALSFKVKVPASEYAKYYFLLRSMLIKSGLAGDDLSALNPLDVQGARKLQQVSSQFESLSLSKGDPLGPNQRSKSLDPRSIQKAAALAHSSTPKLGLEQVVKM